MAFKGGTSLSKIYGIIDRFSEDVDVTLDYRCFDDEFDPFSEGVSKTKIEQFSDRLRAYVKGYADEVIAPALKVAAEALPTSDQHQIKVDDSGEKIWFSYPSAVENHDDYLKSDVLLELGSRNVIDPNEQHEITPEVAALTPGLDYPKASVTVLAPSRTFWEKATLIHVECNRGRLKESPDRLSRHWYDITCLAGHDAGTSAISDRGLMEDVVRHKKIFVNSSYANYDACLNGNLRLVPDADDMLGLKVDYRKMTSAGMLNAEVPDFDSMIEHVREV